MAQPSIPQPASTVVLARPSADGGFEIFMNRRPDKMDVYAGVYVFPGGRVENADWSAPMLRLVRGVSPGDAQQKLASAFEPDVCLGFWVAAVRELFEEAGIHFFIEQESAAPAGGGALSERLAPKRAELQQGQYDLPALMAAERLYCDVSRLNYFFHRITPEHYPVRFDTRFYLAALPQGQVPLDSSEEVSESLWLTPKAALARSEDKSFRMMPPTIAVLRTLAEHGSWSSLSAAFNLR